MEVGQTIRGKVEKLIFGGSGLIRHEGWVIFVPQVAVGEEVEVRLTENKKSYFFAELVQVVQKSPLRIAPKCPYFGPCGGCQLQHLPYEEHLRLKASWLKESFERIAKLPLSEEVVCIPANSQWAYRRKIILHMRNGHVGYFKRDSHSLIEIDSCDISSCTPAFFNELRECISWFKGKETVNAEIAVMTSGDGKTSFHFHFETALPENARQVYRKAKEKFLQWEHLWFENAKSKGDETVLEEVVDGLTIFSSPRVFIQNYPEQSMRIYRDVLALLDDQPILDLYCGIGILSMLAAKEGKKVLGVELNSESVRLAQKSAAFNELQGVEFLSLFAEDIDKIKGLSKYTTWIINPPRTGLSPKVAQIVLKYKPQRLIYVSCMPPTLARDIKIFHGGGYELEKVTAYDMFPQTTHLETLVSLKLTKN